MPTIKRRQQFTANQRIANIVEGDQFEFLDRPSNVKLYACNDISVNAGLVDIELFLSSRLVMPAAPISSRAARGINVQSDLICDTFGDAGMRVVVGGTETTGAISDLEVMVVITPIA